MNPSPDKNLESLEPSFNVVCSWCGAVIRSSTIETSEQMCLICHARMLNDYFQRLRQLTNEKRRPRRV